MNRIILLAFFTVLSCSVFGQAGDRKVGLDIDMGGSVPTNGSISSVFSLGMNASIGPKFALSKKRNLWLKPVGGFLWYYKPSNAGDGNGSPNAVTEHFRTWKAGVEVQYVCYQLRKYSIEPLARIDYNWSANYYSETIAYDPGTNTNTVAKSENVLSGNGLSYDLGCRVRRGKFYIKLDYEYYRPSLDVNKQIVSDAGAQGLIIPASQTFNFSSFNFGIGFTY